MIVDLQWIAFCESAPLHEHGRQSIWTWYRLLDVLVLAGVRERRQEDEWHGGACDHGEEVVVPTILLHDDAQRLTGARLKHGEALSVQDLRDRLNKVPERSCACTYIPARPLLLHAGCASPLWAAFALHGTTEGAYRANVGNPTQQAVTGGNGLGMRQLGPNETDKHLWAVDSEANTKHSCG